MRYATARPLTRPTQRLLEGNFTGGCAYSVPIWVEEWILGPCTASALPAIIRSRACRRSLRQSSTSLTA